MKKMHLAGAILTLLAGWSLSGQEGPIGSCQIFGQVFGNDPLGGGMLAKRPAGDIGGLRFDPKTVFARVSLDTNPAPPARIAAPEVNIGDLICSRTSEGREALVASRAEIQKQQKPISSNGRSRAHRARW